MLHRQTKIVVTLGPSLVGAEKYGSAIQAGANVFRANFSHGTREEHAECIHQLRQLSHQLEHPIAILADLQGPKIRIASFKNSPIDLKAGETFTIDLDLAEDEGDQERVGCNYQLLAQDLRAGDRLLLDDGHLELLVEKIQGKQIVCRVILGGKLSNHKGINRFGGGLSAQALTEKDKLDLKTACELGVDYLAISFPRYASDMLEARKLLDEAGGKQIGLIAKIERAEAVENIDEILRVSDGVMVARGDLGVEIGDAEIPAVQKNIIKTARAHNKISITATQMMESMIHQSHPTRAEVSDVANAVLDGTDAVMLSAETASGAYPIEAIKAMNRICLAAEKNRLTEQNEQQLASQVQRIDHAIALASMYTATHLPISAIISLTESGSTPIWMSRIRTNIPIYAVTRRHNTEQRLCLCRGVHPIYYDATTIHMHELERAIIDTLKAKELLKEGEMVILTRGDVIGVYGFTDMMKIHRV